MKFDLKFYNVIMLGVAFMLVFTAFQTCGMIQTVVLDSVSQEDPNFNASGYTSLAIIYLVFAFSNWISPSIVAVLGPKIAMILGALLYCLFISGFVHVMEWMLYLTSVTLGVGAATIWTAQGNFLTINSNSETIARNSGLFWALMQCSMLIGNIFVFFQLQGKDRIDKGDRQLIFSVLLGVGFIGTCLMLFFRKPRVVPGEEQVNEPKGIDAAMQAAARAFKLFKTRDMLLLSISFFYTGLELGFYSGVYGTCIGFTLNLNQSKRLVGLNGIFIGVGEIIGGLSFGILGKKTNKYGRDLIFVLGFVLQMVGFFCAFINLPGRSPIGETYDNAYIETNAVLAMFTSFILGLGDSCFNTQVYSILGFMYAEDSAPAFALFKFVQSLAAAASFFYSNHLLLHWHLLILVIGNFFSVLAFSVVEWSLHVRKQRELRAAVNGSEEKFN